MVFFPALEKESETEKIGKTCAYFVPGLLSTYVLTKGNASSTFMDENVHCPQAMDYLTCSEVVRQILVFIIFHDVDLGHGGVHGLDCCGGSRCQSSCGCDGH